MSKIITLTEAEFEKYCKAEKVSTVFAPEEYNEGLSLKLAESKVEVSKGIETFMSKMETPQFDIDFKGVVDSYSAILKANPEQSEYILNILEYLAEMDSASVMLLSEVNNILDINSSSGPSDDRISIVANLMLKVEVFLKMMDDFIRLYKKSFEPQGDFSKFDFKYLDSVSLQLRNSICDVIQELLEINPELKQSELYGYLNSRFCPQSFGEYQTRIQNQSFWQSLKNKVRDISRAVYAHGISHSVYGMWQNSFTKRLAQSADFLNRHYYTVYFILIFTSNIGLENLKNALSFDMAFIDILVVLGNAACLTARDPLVLGAITKWLTQKLSATATFNLLSQNIYKAFGVILGNTVAYLGPVFFSSKLKEWIDYFISLVCYLSTSSAGIASKIGLYFARGGTRVATVLYNELAKSGNVQEFGQALENWWSIITREGSEEITRLFVNVLGGNLKNIVNYFLELSVSNLQDITKSGREYVSGKIENIVELSEFSWKFTKSTFNDIYSYLSLNYSDVAKEKISKGIPYYGISTREYFTNICLSNECIPAETLFERTVRFLKKNRQELIKNLDTIIDSIKNYGLVCSNYISDYLSDTVTMFSSIFKTCINKFYEFLEMIKAVMALYYFSTETYTELKYGDSINIVNDLEEKVKSLERREDYRTTQIKVKNLLVGSRKRKR